MINKFYLTIILISCASFAFAQSAILKGQVIDEQTKEPISGAYIHFDDKKGAAVTDAFGHYSITGIIPGLYKVKVKYVGYGEFEKEINLTVGQAFNLDAKLTQKSESLKELKI